ncbi:hypothetical protein GCM10025867_31190 [Frondihabitans sucicola]|uniref:Uncharacterized protein n=1 Tax=Frondihabitans sucicola TaxID=1268041 RepID=A0ABN6Y109_9MICO|nr:hypothetical protein GCM10025867_31190 [Frondihabitans sucicola]
MLQEQSGLVVAADTDPDGVFREGRVRLRPADHVHGAIRLLRQVVQRQRNVVLPRQATHGSRSLVETGAEEGVRDVDVQASAAGAESAKGLLGRIDVQDLGASRCTVDGVREIGRVLRHTVSAVTDDEVRRGSGSGHPLRRLHMEPGRSTGSSQMGPILRGAPSVQFGLSSRSAIEHPRKKVV